MYSVSHFGAMIEDKIRTTAYVEALRSAVSEGSVVLDIGTGTGVFALLACQMGAKKVYAIEPAGAILVGREMARDNGFEDRIEFLQALSTDVEPPQHVDVVVSDLRGCLPLLGPSIQSIIDARERWLKPEGVLIPKSDTMWAAPFEAEEFYAANYERPWLKNDLDLDMRAGHPIAVNNWRHARLDPKFMLADPAKLTTLDYRHISDPNIRARVELKATRDAVMHGFHVWFEACLAPGISFSSSPGSPKLVYGTAFFPLEAPVRVTSGDSIDLSFRAHLVGGDYVWQWDTRVSEGGARESTKAEFGQSTFLGTPLSLDKVRKRSEEFSGTLNDKGKIDARILELIGEGMTLGEVGRVLTREYPKRFPTWRDALSRAGALAVKYCK